MNQPETQPTGIVRRIDDLGRIVIPKEIRKLMRIYEGDALELCINRKTNVVTFQPYRPLADWKMTKEIMWVLWKRVKDSGNSGLALMDNQSVITAYGTWVKQPCTPEMHSYIWDAAREAYADTQNSKPLTIEHNGHTIVLYPVKNQDCQTLLTGVIVQEIDIPAETTPETLRRSQKSEIECSLSANMITALESVAN